MPDSPAVAGRALRSSPRITQRLSLRGENLSGHTLDLSSEGFRAEVRGPLEVGQHLDLEVGFDRSVDQESGHLGARVRAEVRWVKFEPGIGGLAGFRLLESLSAPSAPAPPEALSAPEAAAGCAENDGSPVRTGRLVKVDACLLSFTWNCQTFSLVLEFKNSSGRIKSVLFPGCENLSISEFTAGIAVATLLEYHRLDQAVDDAASRQYQLHDKSGKVLVSFVSQPFQVIKSRENHRKVVAFRRASKSAVGF
jgi:hypothetical protein